MITTKIGKISGVDRGSYTEYRSAPHSSGVSFTKARQPTEQCLLSACAMNLIRLAKAANAAFFYCLGGICQRLFHLGGICQQRRNATPFYHHRRCSI